MYLKALEIQGFKSFPDKTVLTFDRDVTVVVGPNGSGKSNISDALLWVMGEQKSRMLRGGKMQDVIFGGTEKRGAMGFAQVTLILDNSTHILPIESDEVSISRKYYRSGESEYSINREEVRLRDVTELLMDTGLGTDGYSIIGQGRISEIVSAKSTDRREIFEEAAGIARYRHRKEESERKLAHAEEDLLRIGDKISELEMQIGPLEKQSEVAKQFLLYRDDLRLREISLWCATLDKLQSQTEIFRRDIERARNECAAARSDQDRLYAESERLTNRLHETELEAETLRDELRQSDAAAAETESAIAVLTTNLANNADSLERLRGEIAEQDSRAGGLQKQIDDHLARITEIDDEVSGLCAKENALRTSELELAAGMDETNSTLAELVARESELNSALAESRTSVAILTENIAEIGRQSVSAKENLALAEQKKTEAEAQLIQARRDFAAANEKADSLKNVIAGHTMLMGSREAKVTELSNKHTSLTVSLSDCESRLALLAELEKELEGFSKATKAVVNEAQHGALRGIREPLGKAISIRDDYALAIETALGASVGFVITETQEAAKAAIEFLNRRGIGRTTFLPMDVLRPQRLSDVPHGENGFLGICAELVDCPEEYKNVVFHQLGTTVLCDTLANAIKISRKHHQGFRIVTLDGQLVNAGGSLTGGSAVKNVGILSRANEIMRLRQKRESLQQQLSAVTAEKQEAERVLEAARYDLEAAREEYSAACQESVHFEGIVSQAQILNEAAEQALDTLEEDIRTAGSREKQLRDRIDELEIAAEEAEKEISAVRSVIESESRGVEEFESHRKKLEEQFSVLRSERASKEAEKNTVLLAVDQLRSLCDQLHTDSADRTASLEALQRRSIELAEEKKIQNDKLAEQRGKAASEQERLEELTRRRLELEGRRGQADKNAQNKNRDLLDAERSVSQLEQKLQASEMEEKQILDKLWDSYELSRTEAITLAQPVENMAQAGREVTELRHRISALGNVNIGAIEEYQRVSERYNFLSEQRDDAENAKGEIQKILGEITGRMESIFIEQMELINKAFQEIFLELFGGGKAALSLEDESDPLNCGIDIRIQPPGKAVSNISLLSGGEKSFVAIALYFAILRVRPAPFCMLDEIESALDEENVFRFAEYMRRMSKSTQFIAITHRRGTMETADQLYGVTMQEKGVSTVLAMDLEQAVKTIK